MAYLAEALEIIREESDTRAEAGRTFEELVADAFRSHPGEWGRDRFAQVWAWEEWTGKAAAGFDGSDIGIDLVAEQTEIWGGGLCAVQCKLRKGASEVPTKEIDSFLAAAPENIFSAHLVVTTTDLSRHGLRKLELRRGKVLYTADMDGWVDDWREAVPRSSPVEIRTEAPKKPRPHQEEALAAIREGWESGADRGQLILPCGTGKTLTSLWSAIDATEPGDDILFLVPSLALMSQTMREWSANKTSPLQFLAVCSDAGVGRNSEDRNMSELFAEVTTSPEEIREALSTPIPQDHRRAVFCTYHSSPVLAGVVAGREFALAIFDEAHRTTGLEVEGAFQTGLHDRNIACRRRLFMTATPRVFTEKQRSRVAGGMYDGESYTMDDATVYGEEFYRMTFAQAIDRDLLSDYQIHVVMVGEEYHLAIGDGASFKWENLVPDFQPRGKKGEDGNRAPALPYDDALRLAGCWDALATPYSPGWTEGHRTGGLDEELGKPAGTALLYANKVTRSDEVAQVWAALAAHEATAAKEDGGDGEFLELGVDHMDGTTPAARRSEQLRRLQEASKQRGSGRCEIISNVKVLTEGVDVPGLDAVIFLDPRTSAVDVTQAVGRAMRKSPGKEQGHVIVPVLVKPGADAEHTLTKSSFSDLAAVIRALRSHDDRLNYHLSDPETAALRIRGRLVSGSRGEGDRTRLEGEELLLALTHKVASEMVDRCGDKKMWPSWGKKAGEAAERVERMLRDAIDESAEVGQVFLDMCKDFREVGINATPNEVREMIAQHIVTIPIFDAMFGEQFSQDNPVSRGIGNVLVALEEAGVSFDAERAVLARTYKRMEEILEAAEQAAAGRGDPFGKADVIRQIYDGLFKDNKGMAEKVVSLGIVYTPEWIVDFMLRSIDAVCRKHFGTPIDEDVRFLDPFAGTGIFPTRLLTAKGSSGDFLVSDSRLEETWGNLYGGEIVMLPYYAAALGTEESYRRRLWERDGEDPGYRPWPGLVLQDSFLASGGQGEFEGMGENVRRSARVLETPVDVICTNPPWLAGAKREGEVGKKKYPQVAKKIRETYINELSKIDKYPSAQAYSNLYIHAMRWATDRLAEGDGEGKVLAMVNPNQLLEKTSLAGLRAGLSNDYTDIYVVNLRGTRKSGEAARREGDNVFESGTQSGVQITILVKEPGREGKQARVRLAECDEYLRRPQKRNWLENEVGDVTSPLLREIEPGDDHWWGKPDDPLWEKLLPLAKDEQALSRSDPQGIKTGADHLFVSRHPDVLAERMEEILGEYERLREEVWGSGKKPSEQFVDRLCAPTPLHRSRKLKDQLQRGTEITFDATNIIPILYRPFVRRFLYADIRVLQMFPVGLREWAKRVKSPPTHKTHPRRNASRPAGMPGDGHGARTQRAGSGATRKSLPAIIYMGRPAPSPGLVASDLLPDLGPRMRAAQP